MVPDEISLLGQLRDLLATPSQAWDLLAKLGSPLERDPVCRGEERELTLHLRSQVIDLITAETDGIFVDTSQASATLTALERRIEKRIAGEGSTPLAFTHANPALRYTSGFAPTAYTR